MRLGGTAVGPVPQPGFAAVHPQEQPPTEGKCDLGHEPSVSIAERRAHPRIPEDRLPATRYCQSAEGALEGDDPLANRVLGEFRDRAQPEFAHDVAAMHLDGADRYVKLLGNRR